LLLSVVVAWSVSVVSAMATAHAPERTVIIGDSQAEGLKNAGLLPKMGVEIYAFPGAQSEFFVGWLATHASAVMNKDLVVFQVGGNDISHGDDAAHIQANMLALARLSRAYNPNAEVVFGAIPVRGQWFDAQKRKHKLAHKAVQREETLEGVNFWLAYDRHPEFSLFRLNAIVADPEAPRLQRAEYKRQGKADVHLNARGYVALSRALAGTWISQR
jgi:lysophospholipase L1-like esterase